MEGLQRIHEVFVIKGCQYDASLIINDSSEFIATSMVGSIGSSTHYYTISENPVGISLEEVLLDNGQWLGVFSKLNTREKIITADYFGFSTAFYSIVNQGALVDIVISDSFRGLSSYLFKQGIVGNLNWDIILPHLLSNTNLFLTRASDYTFHKNIFCLNYKKIIYMKNGRFNIINRELLNKKNIKKSYDTLVDEGINLAIKNFESVVSDDREICLNLSGGKDSRVVLSMLLNSKKKDGIRCLTSNPFCLPAGATKDILLQDFRLASKIVSQYKLDWFHKDNYSEYLLSYEEQLGIWQDFRSNSSFELRPKHSQTKDCKELRITGIGGELFRSYLGAGYKISFAQWWNENQDKATVVALKGLFRSLCNSWLLDSQVYSRLEEAFVDSFLFNNDGDVLSQLDESYLAYRNRAHAGVAGVHNFEGAVLKYPLAQASFREANLLLSKEEQFNGKILFDIIERTAPELNYLEFASPAWDKSLSVKLTNSKNIRLWESTNNEKTLEKYKSIANRKVNKRYDDRNLTKFDVYTESLLRLERNLELIRSNQSAEIDLSPVIERIARLQQKNLNMLSALVSKTETILDVLFPTAIKSKVMTLCSTSDQSKLIANELFESNSLSSILTKIDLSTISVQLEIQDLVLEISYSNVPLDCFIAIYLYIDGEKVHVDWYDQFSKKIYDISQYKNKNIRVMSFFKREGEPEAQKVMNSEIYAL